MVPSQPDHGASAIEAKDRLAADCLLTAIRADDQRPH